MANSFNSFNFDKVNIEDTSGINEETLRNVIIEIYDYVERINKRFESIEILMSKVPSCFKSQNSKNFTKQFLNLKSNFPIIEANIKNYADDLNKVRINYQKRVDEAVSYLNNSSK